MVERMRQAPEAQTLKPFIFLSQDLMERSGDITEVLQQVRNDDGQFNIADAIFLLRGCFP